MMRTPGSGFLAKGFRPLAAMAFAVGAAMAFQPAYADTAVKVTLDWAFQGPQSPFLLAAERGYYKAEGLDVTIDRGEGSGAVPTRIASGAYDIGFGDINPTIRFMAEKESDLIAVAVLYDSSPLAAITLAKTGIKEPKDLQGRTVAAPETDSGRQLFPAFAAATGIDASKINWQTVTPQLRETLLAQGQVDAITGFLTTGIFSLRGAGVPMEDIVVMRYRDHGVPLYSNALITSKAFAAKNPEALKGFIRATIKGHIEAIKDPAAAIEALKKRDPLINAEVEQNRLKLAIDELIVSPSAKEGGLSHVDPARMQKSIDILNATYKFPRALTPADVYTDAYLPPKAERMLP